MQTRNRPLSSLVAALVGALLVASAPAADAASPVTSGAATADLEPSVPPSRWLVGGCLVVFAADGTPAVRATSQTPCVGVADVGVDRYGDLTVHLTAEESAPALTLQATAGSSLVRRGIVTGVSGGGSVVSVRLYDDQQQRRVNLRTAAGRARVAGTNLHVGWTKAGGHGAHPDPQTVDPGYDALGRHRDLAAPPLSTVRGGCVVRFDQDGPWVHANPSHRCIGVRSVRITTTGRVLVEMTSEQDAAVLNVQADADETMTTKGISAGVSVAGSRLIIDLYDARIDRGLDLRREADRRRAAGAYSNLWLSWTKTISRPGSRHASTSTAPHAYGAYMYGSSTPDEVVVQGCTIRLRAGSPVPVLSHGGGRLCTGVSSAWIEPDGDLTVRRDVVGSSAVLSTTSLSSRTLTDRGIRVGLSKGLGYSTYRFWSMKDGRRLDLADPVDRRLLERSGAELVLGWSNPLVSP